MALYNNNNLISHSIECTWFDSIFHLPNAVIIIIWNGAGFFECTQKTNSNICCYYYYLLHHLLYLSKLYTGWFSLNEQYGNDRFLSLGGRLTLLFFLWRGEFFWTLLSWIGGKFNEEFFLPLVFFSYNNSFWWKLHFFKFLKRNFRKTEIYWSITS